jgi:hypothetical protein
MFGPDVISQYGLVYIDIAPPPAPNLKGDLWFNPENGYLYIYTDPDWVNTQGGEGTAGEVNKILAGLGISVTPEDGVGVVTVSSTTTIPFFTTLGEEKPIPLKP